MRRLPAECRVGRESRRCCGYAQSDMRSITMPCDATRLRPVQSPRSIKPLTPSGGSYCSTYGGRSATRPRVKEQKSINMLSSPSVRTIIVDRASSRRGRQYHWRFQSVPLSLTACSFVLTDLAGLPTSRPPRPAKVTEHFGSHATMNSNGAAALLTMPGHRGPPAMSAAAAAELVEARGEACGGHPHSHA